MRSRRFFTDTSCRLGDSQFFAYINSPGTSNIEKIIKIDKIWKNHRTLLNKTIQSQHSTKSHRRMFSLRALIPGRTQIFGGSAGAFKVSQSIRSVSLLSELHPSLNSTRNHKRVGRGPSSGYGKTSGRGQKGQKARGTVKPWFEGGQTPIVKLFPKVGFKRVNAPQFKVVNLNRISEFLESGRLDLAEDEVLTMRKMKQVGLITGTLTDGVKILAQGKEFFPYKLKIEASAASTEAIRAIERAGGEFTARYFSKLSLRAHLHPEYFLKTRGHIPLEARPTRRRDVHYYSRMDKRGYLIKENNKLYQAIQNAKVARPTIKASRTTDVGNLGAKVNENAEGFRNSGIFKLSDLKL